MDAYQLMHDGTLALGRAERQGMRIDVEYCKRNKALLTKKIEHTELRLSKTKFFRHWKHATKSRINIYSNNQLANYLYKTKKFKPIKLTPTGQGAADDEALSQLNIPELDLILKARRYKKIRDTYIDSFLREQVNGVMHPFFNLNLARTFRSSSDHPNFQNIPTRDEEAAKMCRGAILPRENHQLIEFDYKSIEVSVSECYHLDPVMREYIEDPKSDMHRDMAIQIFLLDKFDKMIPSHKTLRSAAKNGFVFPQFYGDYYVNCAYNLACIWGKLPSSGTWKAKQGIPFSFKANLADHLISKGIKSLDQFTKHIKKIENDFWNRRFKVYQQWKDAWWKKYQRKGYLDMLTGFRCSGMMNQKQVGNTPIQGSAFHCCLWSFNTITKIQEELEKWNSKLIGQVHDSLLMDVDPDEREHVIETVTRVTCEELPKAWPWIIVPLNIEVETCEVNAPWSEKK